MTTALFVLALAALVLLGPVYLHEWADRLRPVRTYHRPRD